MQIKGVYICDGKACASCETNEYCTRTFNEDHALNKDIVELVHLIKEKFNIISDPTSDKLYFEEKMIKEE